MILGVGTDVVDIADLQRRLERTPALADRVYAPEEVALCRSRNPPWPCFAARFAGKEAVMKALGTGWAEGVTFADIVILESSAGGLGSVGNPRVELRGVVAQLVEAQSARLVLSLSHDDSLAIAMAALWRDPAP